MEESVLNFQQKNESSQRKRNGRKDPDKKFIESLLVHKNITIFDNRNDYNNFIIF